METEIDCDARSILALLAAKPRDQFVPATELAAEAKLSPERVNDAVALLVESGYAEWIQVMGTAPFDFGDAYITSRGRYEQQRRSATESKIKPQPTAAPAGATMATNQTAQALPPTPVGSPYGFTDEDWETVSRHKARADRLYVVFGHQFESAAYDTVMLRQNVQKTFEAAVQRFNETSRGHVSVKLKFNVLAAGYGEHLFNQIARGIIGADIAVFDTSDLNANVMLEMGVALTWGVRVLPIKAQGRPVPPSDVSGQTWVDYQDSGAQFVDPDHLAKLVAMIERALRKKVPAAV